jgi:tetratricopeptide (TPR) repeat protein
MGVVYAAFDPELDRKIALKLLRPSLFGTDEIRRARLLREAQAMARVSHPNVVPVYDVGSHADQVFVAMELVDGGTLTDWVSARRRPVGEILQAFTDAGRGLAAAHAAGLVHRDFKPENVLVGRDGRVRVTDFGLARLDDHRSPTVPVPVLRGSIVGEAPARRPNLTQAGAIMGTPLFMSPEQAEGTVPDARSDQYSFCASLYWALFGVAPPGPFTRYLGGAVASPEASTEDDGRRLLAPSRTEAAGVPFPKDPRLSARIRRALARGLAEAPDRRFESMDALLRELAVDSLATSRRRWLAVSAALVLAAAAVASHRLASPGGQVCSGAAERLAGVWNDGVRTELTAAFERAEVPGARATADRVAAILDGYGQSWVAMHTEACQATRVRGEQTEDILALRMICLERRLNQLGALTKLLRTADAAMVQRALDAALDLSSVPACADVAALTLVSPLPADPALRRKVEELNRTLDEVRALLASAQFKVALPIAEDTARQAEAVPYWPLRAEAAYWRGRLLDRLGDPRGANQALREAVLAAESGRAEEEKVRALLWLVRVNGYSLGRFDEAHFLADLAEAALRSTPNERLEFDLLRQRGGLLSHQGKLREALVPYQRALSLADRAVGPTHPGQGLLLSDLAAVYGALGRHQEALALLPRAIEIITATRGTEHPSLAWAYYNLARTQAALGDYRQAHASIQEAIRIRGATLGPDHPEVASALDILATILHADGLFAEALAEAERALAIKRKALGEEHVDLCYSLENIGLAHLGLGQPAKAIPVLERALALRERARLEPGESAEGRFALARALWDTGRNRARARTLAAAAREGYQSRNDLEHASQVNAWLASR